MSSPLRSCQGQPLAWTAARAAERSLTTSVKPASQAGPAGQLPPARTQRAAVTEEEFLLSQPDGPAAGSSAGRRLASVALVARGYVLRLLGTQYHCCQGCSSVGMVQTGRWPEEFRSAMLSHDHVALGGLPPWEPEEDELRYPLDAILGDRALPALGWLRCDPALGEQRPAPLSIGRGQRQNVGTLVAGGCLGQGMASPLDR
ncbi:MAG: hypothetical protein KatS3mg061_1615 [Dehalococcoidia bacterium]|nr:MAG: hypothetical protein KatS3mg061_1615 [Dehalococcoidia bacterium]